LAQRDAADTDYEATIDVKQMDLLFIPTAYSAKKKANGSDPDYAATGRTDDQSAVHSVSNTTSAGSGEIGQLRSELTSLQQTVEELKSRLEAEGR
jgi:TolA-binding protein